VLGAGSFQVGHQPAWAIAGLAGRHRSMCRLDWPGADAQSSCPGFVFPIARSNLGIGVPPPHHMLDHPDSCHFLAPRRIWTALVLPETGCAWLPITSLGSAAEKSTPRSQLTPCGLAGPMQTRARFQPGRIDKRAPACRRVHNVRIHEACQRLGVLEAMDRQHREQLVKFRPGSGAERNTEKLA